MEYPTFHVFDQLSSKKMKLRLIMLSLCSNSDEKISDVDPIAVARFREMIGSKNWFSTKIDALSTNEIRLRPERRSRVRLDVGHPFHLLLAFTDCVLKMGSIPSALSPHTDRFPSAHSELVSLRPLHLSLSGNTLFDTVCAR